jgi:hypothetical protein
MASTEPAGPGEQPDSTAPRLVVVLARDGGESRVCRVDAPDRVLRIWGLLSNCQRPSSIVPACYRRVIADRLLQTPAAQELPPGGGLRQRRNYRLAVS